MKRNRVIAKVVALVMTCCMVLSTFGPIWGPKNTAYSKELANNIAPASVVSSFVDVKGHWAEGQLTEWLAKHWINGYADGTFRPDHKISRGEFMALVNRAFGFTEKAVLSFKDVNASDWSYDDISIAVKAGYIEGYADGTIGAEHPISRQEVAVIVCRLLNLDDMANLETVNAFRDAEQIAQWGKGALGATLSAGIIQGYPDETLRSDSAITRAESIVLLDRSVAARYTAMYQQEGIYGPASGIEKVARDVTINRAGVTLRNMNITGNLLLAEGIGEGEVFLENVTVERTTTINGGGINSIHFVNVNLQNVIVNKKGTKVRIVVEKNSKIAKLNVISSALIEIAHGEIKELTVSEQATGVELVTGEDAMIASLILNAAIVAKGQGKISVAVISEQAKATTFEKLPERIDRAGTAQATKSEGNQREVNPTPSNPPGPSLPEIVMEHANFDENGHIVIVGELNHATEVRIVLNNESYSSVLTPAALQLNNDGTFTFTSNQAFPSGIYPYTLTAVNQSGESSVNGTVQVTIRSEVLLENGGFEDIQGGNATGWLPQGNNWSGFQVKPEAARSGNYGLSISTDESKNPWISYPIAVEEGATYEVSVWFKLIGQTGSASSHVEIYKGFEKTEADIFIKDMIWGHSGPDDQDGQWHELKYTAKAPIGAKFMYVYLWLNGPGKVYYDDVSVVKKEGGPQIVIHNKHTYFYTDLTESDIRIVLQPQDNSYAGKKADIRIEKDGAPNTIIFSKTGVAAVPETTVSFDPSLMQMEQNYKIIVELKDAGQQVIGQEEKTIRRLERPTMVPENGPIYVDNEPFFPVIAYHVNPDEYGELNDLGVNVVEGISSSNMVDIGELLDAADDNGLKVVVPLHVNMQVIENLDLMRQIITEFKDHPAVIAWLLMDEPASNQIPIEEVLEAYELVRSLDPDHPVYLTEAYMYAYESSAQGTDIFLTDLYPFHQVIRRPIYEVGDSVRTAIAAVDGTKPVWTILQTFGVPEWGYDLPTITQVRNMAYQSILAGSKGLAYYSLSDLTWRLRDTILWDGLKQFKQELPLIGSLAIEGVKISEHIDNRVQWGLWSKDSDYYLTVINVTETAQTASIPLESVGNQLELLFGDMPAQWETWDNHLTIQLDSEQAIVYKISPFLNKVEQAIDSLQDVNDIIQNTHWQTETNELASKLQLLRQELTATVPDSTQAVVKATSFLQQLLQLQNWVETQPEQDLEYKKALLETCLEPLKDLVIPILRSIVRFDLQASPGYASPDEDWDLTMEIENSFSQDIDNVKMHVEPQTEVGVAHLEETFGQLQSGNSILQSESYTIPENTGYGTYPIVATVEYDYQGVPVSVIRTYGMSVTPLLEMKLSVNSMFLHKPGVYPIAVELMNHSVHNVEVQWENTAPAGFSIDFGSAVQLAGREKRTISGEITIPSNVTAGFYNFAVGIAGRGSFHDSVPLEINYNTNRVYNPGFEQLTAGGTKADGWVGIADLNVKHTGQASLRLDPVMGNDWNVATNMTVRQMPVEPGKTYVMKGWVKNSSTVGSVAIGIRQVDANIQDVLYTWQETARNSDWTQYEITFTALPQTKAAWIFLKLDGAANGSAWMDDLELYEAVVEAKLSPGAMYLKNPGTYTFAVDLKNSSQEQLTVELPQSVPEGLTLSLDSSVELSGMETKTIQGQVTIPATVTEGVYRLNIKVQIDGIIHGSLPLTIYLGENPIYNPSFEIQAIGEERADGWGGGLWDRDVSHTGQSSMRLDPDPANTWNIVTNNTVRQIEVTPGKSYKLSGWVKNSATTGLVEVGVREVDAAGNDVKYNWISTGNNRDWTKYEVIFTASSQTTHIWPFFKMDQAANASAWLDDLEFEELVYSPVYNPSFEIQAIGEERADGWGGGLWDREVSHTGQSSMRLDPDPANTWNIVTNNTVRQIEVTPGKSYKLSGWVKNSATTGLVEVGVREVDATGNDVKYNWIPTGNNRDWTKYEVIFTASSQTTHIWPFFKMDQTANASAWLDDLEFRELSDCIIWTEDQRTISGLLIALGSF